MTDIFDLPRQSLPTTKTSMDQYEPVIDTRKHKLLFEERRRSMEGLRPGNSLEIN